MPTVAKVEAEKTTDWLAPSPTENGEVGEELTPAGSPSMSILTESVKPLMGLTATVTAALVAPCSTEVEVGETDKLKSGLGVTVSVSVTLNERAPLVPRSVRA